MKEGKCLKYLDYNHGMSETPQSQKHQSRVTNASNALLLKWNPNDTSPPPDMNYD